ncbi:hypothetical protein BGW42_005205 [Actinomortierella wolfii]|nr:hypothetical protein BGW42_005205 [Actinomortierella wolfii]
MFLSETWAAVKDLAGQIVDSLTVKTEGSGQRSDDSFLDTFSKAPGPVPSSTALFYHAGIGTSSVHTFQLMDEYFEDTFDPETGYPRYCSMWELQLELGEIPSAISNSINLLERCGDHTTVKSSSASDYGCPLDHKCVHLATHTDEKTMEDVEGVKKGVKEKRTLSYHTNDNMEKRHETFHDVDLSHFNYGSSNGVSDSEPLDTNEIRKLHDAITPLEHLYSKSISTVNIVAASKADGIEDMVGGEVQDYDICVYLEEVDLTFFVPPLIAEMVDVAS